MHVACTSFVQGVALKFLLYGVLGQIFKLLDTDDNHTPSVASQSCVKENLFEHYRHLEQELKNILVRNLLDTHILLLSLTNGTNHLHETIVHTTISQTTISTAQSNYLLNFKR